MPEPTPELRVLAGRYGAEVSWSQTADRSARTAPGRQAAMERFERQVDPDDALDPAERARRAAHAQRAHMMRMALASAKARRAKAARKAKRAPGGEAVS